MSGIVSIKLKVGECVFDATLKEAEELFESLKCIFEKPNNKPFMSGPITRELDEPSVRWDATQYGVKRSINFKTDYPYKSNTSTD